MLSWQVDRVKITHIVEMDLPVPARFMRQATSAKNRSSMNARSDVWSAVVMPEQRFG